MKISLTPCLRGLCVHGRRNSFDWIMSANHVYPT